MIGDSATKGELQKTGNTAREKKIGIFSATCTQQTNTKKPSCDIKGNDGPYGKFYYLPECGMYNQAVVQLYRGDQWFCTEQEAKKAGFRSPSQCP